MDTTETIEAFAARALGMKRREIIGATRVADGLVVTMHDGQRTLLANDGTVHPWTGELPVPDQDVAPEPAKAKTRAR